MHIHKDRSKKFLYLSQDSEYIDKVLLHFNMDRGKALSTPLLPYVKLSKQDCLVSDEDKVEMDKLPYASTMCSLMYAMIATILDIAFGCLLAYIYILNPCTSALFFCTSAPLHLCTSAPLACLRNHTLPLYTSFLLYYLLINKKIKLNKNIDKIIKKKLEKIYAAENDA